MKAWKIDHLGGKLSYVDIPVPEVRPGSVLVRVQSQSLMSYLKPYVEGKLAAYRAPENFVPGGNTIGTIEAVGADVWHLKKGQRVVTSSHLIARENVQEPGQILIGITSPGGVGDELQHSWKDGTLAEYTLLPAQTVTPIEGLEQEPGQILIGITSPGGVGDELQHSWKDGTLAEYTLLPAQTVTPIEGLDHHNLPQLTAITRCIVPFGGLVRRAAHSRRDGHRERGNRRLRQCCGSSRACDGCESRRRRRAPKRNFGQTRQGWWLTSRSGSARRRCSKRYRSA